MKKSKAAENVAIHESDFFDVTEPVDIIHDEIPSVAEIKGKTTTKVETESQAAQKTIVENSESEPTLGILLKQLKDTDI